MNKICKICNKAWQVSIYNIAKVYVCPHCRNKVNKKALARGANSNKSKTNNMLDK